MNRYLLSAFAAGTICSGSLALAQVLPPPPRGSGHMLFEVMDGNKDGVVTRSEVSSALEQRFAALDTNRDGSISPEERKAARDKMRERRTDERFAMIDANHDGQLSRAEFGAAHQRPMPGPDGTPPPPGPLGDRKDGPGHGWHHRAGGPGGWGKGQDDPEATVTKAEFMARPLALFDRMDSNKDGKITAAERAAAMEHFHRGQRDRSDTPKS